MTEIISSNEQSTIDEKEHRLGESSADEDSQIGGESSADIIRQLQERIIELESQMEEQRRDISLASKVSHEVTRVVDMKELLPFVSELTQESF